jgi:hypothetical protein
MSRLSLPMIPNELPISAAIHDRLSIPKARSLSWIHQRHSSNSRGICLEFIDKYGLLQYQTE